MRHKRLVTNRTQAHNIRGTTMTTNRKNPNISQLAIQEGDTRHTYRLAVRVAQVLAAAIGAATMAVAVLPAAANASPAAAASSGAVHAQTCYSTVGFSACLAANEYWNGVSAWSSGRSYWCSNWPIYSSCNNHSEGSFWDPSYNAWENWANTSIQSNTLVKTCVYLRLDISPNGHQSTRAWEGAAIPLWQSC
jgi:hypothetical protein